MLDQLANVVRVAQRLDDQKPLHVSRSIHSDDYTSHKGQVHLKAKRYQEKNRKSVNQVNPNVVIFFIAGLTRFLLQTTVLTIGTDATRGYQVRG